MLKRYTRAVRTNVERLWDDGIIPYVIDKKIFGRSQQALFKEAMRHWENFTCIKFVERDPKYHRNYILFTIRECECCSDVGKRGNGRQAISIGRNCEKFGIVVHELGHVIGFWHEHTRTDRDEHVIINRDNIMNGQENNFHMRPAEEIDSMNMTYDYGSIMHYARNTFSKSLYLDTILPVEKENRDTPKIGQREHLSAGDILQANALYKCPTCGMTFLQNKGHFTSPNYFSDLNVTENCEWRINARHSERIIINIENLNLLKSENCEVDFLEIRDGYWKESPLLGRLCGEMTSETMTTLSNRLLITYSNSNKQLGYKGFSASYKVSCGGDFFINNNEKLESPNYPSEYLSNKYCIWRITVPEDHQVVLKFETFELEDHANCVFDYLEVRDGDNENSTLIGRFCGYNLPPNIKTNFNKMFIKFISDDSNEKSGFSAILLKEIDECDSGEHGCEHECINTLGSYECNCFAGYELDRDGKSCKDSCGGVIEVDNSTTFSHSLKDKSSILKKCIWDILAPEDKVIFINFTEFHFGESKRNHLNCKHDSIAIYSKYNKYDYKEIDDYCGTKLPALITSETNTLRIELELNKRIHKSEIKAEIFTGLNFCATNNGECEHYCKNTIGSYICSCRKGYILHENGHSCNQTSCKHVLSSPFGTVSSPNYPDNYTKNLYCIWNFKTLLGHRIRLTFHKFDIEYHQECIYDHLIAYDGHSENNSTLGIFCGKNEMFSIISSTNELYMVFISEGNIQRTGFFATFSTDCGGYLHASNETQQIVSHPRYGHRNYRRNMNCKWIIQADSHKSVKIEFPKFELEFSENCEFDYVEIIDDALKNSFYGKFCGTKAPPEIISISDSLIINFISDEGATMGGFLMNFKAVNPPKKDHNRTEQKLVTPFPGYYKNIYSNGFD